MKIIPAIDIYKGKCVRLVKGDYNLKKEYSSDPLIIAKEFENNGATHVHVVDLEGAKSHTIINKDILYEICVKTNLKVDFGGGIKSKDDISLAFDLGVNQITLGSVAVTNKDLLIDSLNVYGKEKIILGADFLDNVIKINGWKTQPNIIYLISLTNTTVMELHMQSLQIFQKMVQCRVLLLIYIQK